MINDNKRYLGDVFINAENKEIQAQFFRDIIQSYQGKLGGTFNAYSLWDEESQTEKLVSDFATAEQGELADNSLQSPIRIGRKEIANIEDKQYIYTDATLLDDDNQNLMNVEWFSDLTDTSLSNVLIAIRDAVNIINSALQENIDEKLDITTYNTFYNTDYEPFKSSLTNILTEFEDEYGDSVTRLNADMVNGLRFRLITQEKYDQLDAREKNYWRNVFIIKEASEIPPDYVDPMQWEWEGGYTFQVNDGYLQFNNGLSNEWKTICSLEDLLTGGSITNIVQNTLASQTFNINGDTISQSLLNISPTTIDGNWRNYPFLSSSLHDDYVETIKINNATDYVTTTINSSTKFKIVNLDIDGIIQNALTPVNTNITNLQNSITGTNGIQPQLTTAQSNIRTLQGNIQTQNGLNQGFRSDINSLTSQVAQLNNTLSALNTNLINLSNGIGTWKSADIPGLKWVSGNTTYQSKCYYNEKLKLAHVYLSFGMYIDADDLNTHADVHKSKNVYEAYYVYAKPISNTSYHSSASWPLDFVKIEPDGRIAVCSTRPKAPNSVKHILASWTYYYSRKSDYY